MFSEDEKNENYTLSYKLLGHSADVRAVRFCRWRDSSAGHCILTASRDGTACVWAPVHTIFFVMERCPIEIYHDLRLQKSSVNKQLLLQCCSTKQV